MEFSNNNKNKLDCKVYEHCLSCMIYHTQLSRMNLRLSSKVQPACYWYIEHVLNGDEVNTKNCIWYQNAYLPIPPTQ